MWSTEDVKLLYKAMFHRKSVRKYEDKPLDKTVLDALMQKTTALESVLPQSKVAYRILSPNQVKGIVAAKAPHFLAVYSDSSGDALIDVAFKLQQMDLWLSANEYGCCWLGMPSPVSDMKTVDGLQYVVMLAFGKPSEPLHRERADQFKRKALTEITDLKGIDELLEPVRLAPSATNRQPWYLSGDTKKIRLYNKQNNFIASKVLGAMTVIDIGIALCHLWLAALETDCFAGFVREENAGKVQGYDYMWSVMLNK